LLKQSSIRFALRETNVPTLTRLLLVLLLLGALGYGAIYALANFVDPREREITVRVKKDGFGR
jgi:hypothetical protein